MMVGSTNPLSTRSTVQPTAPCRVRMSRATIQRCSSRLTYDRPVGVVALHRSASATARLAAAHHFIESLPPASEALVVGAARDAVDDFVRENAARGGAAFGLRRFSLRRLATRIAAPRLAALGLAPATQLGAEAVAARAAFEAAGRGSLGHLAPIAEAPGFGRTLAPTLEDVRGAASRPARCRAAARRRATSTRCRRSTRGSSTRPA